MYNIAMLYTRKGDSGTTKTLNTSDRVSKSSPLPEALGTLDELNSFLGLCRACTVRERGMVLILADKEATLPALLHEIQENLFIVQAELAGAPDKTLTQEKVARLEAITDAIETLIPPITGFSIAGGTELSALLDVSRTLARRAERRLVGVHESGICELSLETLAWMNRLSSALFALARFVNHASGIPEERPKY